MSIPGNADRRRNGEEDQRPGQKHQVNAAANKTPTVDIDVNIPQNKSLIYKLGQIFLSTYNVFVIYMYVMYRKDRSLSRHAIPKVVINFLDN